MCFLVPLAPKQHKLWYLVPLFGRSPSPPPPLVSATVSKYELKIRIQALKIRIQALKIRIPAFKIRIQAFKIRIQAFKLRIQAFKTRIEAFKLFHPAMLDDVGRTCWLPLNRPLIPIISSSLNRLVNHPSPNTIPSSILLVKIIIFLRLTII